VPRNHRRPFLNEAKRALQSSWGALFEKPLALTRDASRYRRPNRPQHREMPDGDMQIATNQVALQ
jgi:hypothetical protein